MLELSTLTTFFGWCSLLNMGLLTLSTFIIIIFQTKASTFHAKLFKIREKEIKSHYFVYLGHYKVLTLVFFVIPYFALKLMA